MALLLGWAWRHYERSDPRQLHTGGRRRSKCCGSVTNSSTLGIGSFAPTTAAIRAAG
jgi:hypothetical protein